MKLEQIVPSLELCKRMKELGIEFVDCPFWWATYEDNKWFILSGETTVYNTYIKREFPAPTVAEMINKLPANIKIGIKTYRPELWKDEDGYGIRYMYFSSKCLMHFRGINLKDEISKMLIYLKENKLI